MELADAAGRLLTAGGSARVSARSIAKSLGVRPSAVNYWFGGRDQLIEVAIQRAAERNRLVVEMIATEFESVPAALDRAAAIMIASIGRMAVVGAEGVCLRWRTGVEAQSFDVANSMAARSWDHIDNFWRGLLGRHGLDASLAEALSTVFEWLARGRLFVETQGLYDALICDVCLRIEARIRCTAPDRAGDSPFRVALAGLAPDAAEPPMNDTQEKIVSAAVRILIDKGPEALTHRLIAKSAGVSLSSTTYHYDSLAEIAGAAYRRLYRDSRFQARDLVDAPKGLRIEQIVGSKNDGQARQPRREFIAMQKLLLGALDQPELRRFSAAAFARMGDGSLRILSALADSRSGLDRLDGFIWRLMATGLAERAALQGGSRDWLSSVLIRGTRALFC